VRCCMSQEEVGLSRLGHPACVCRLRGLLSQPCSGSTISKMPLRLQCAAGKHRSPVLAALLKDWCDRLFGVAHIWTPFYDTVVWGPAFEHLSSAVSLLRDSDSEQLTCPWLSRCLVSSGANHCNTEDSSVYWREWLDTRESFSLGPAPGGTPMGVQFPHLRRLWQAVLL
jgi:hypothetical protein